MRSSSTIGRSSSAAAYRRVRHTSSLTPPPDRSACDRSLRTMASSTFRMVKGRIGANSPYSYLLCYRKFWLDEIVESYHNPRIVICALERYPGGHRRSYTGDRADGHQGRQGRDRGSVEEALQLGPLGQGRSGRHAQSCE